MNESNSITRIGGRASGPPPTTAVTTPLLLELEEDDDDEEELELGDDVEIPPPPPPEVFRFGDKRADELEGCYDRKQMSPAQDLLKLGSLESLLESLLEYDVMVAKMALSQLLCQNAAKLT